MVQSKRYPASATPPTSLLLLLFGGFCLERGRHWPLRVPSLHSRPPVPAPPPSLPQTPQGPLPPCLAAGLPPSSSHPASRMLSPPPEPGTTERSCIHGEGQVWAPAPPSVTQAPSHSRPSPGPSGRPPGQPFRERTNSRQASSALVLLIRGAGSFFVGGGGRLWASWGYSRWIPIAPFLLQLQQPKMSTGIAKHPLGGQITPPRPPPRGEPLF